MTGLRSRIDRAICRLSSKHSTTWTTSSVGLIPHSRIDDARHPTCQLTEQQLFFQSNRTRGEQSAAGRGTVFAADQIWFVRRFQDGRHSGEKQDVFRKRK